MQTNRQELVRAARRRVQRGRKTTGRIVASALGFGVAYYFDAENGGLRRKRLQRTMEHAARSVGARLVPHVGEPPVVFDPLLREPRRGDHSAPHGGRALSVVVQGDRSFLLVRRGVCLSCGHVAHVR